MSATLALVGGRGYTGAEMLGLVAAHPGLELVLASSASQAGDPLRSVCPAWPRAEDRFQALDPAELEHCRADAWVLAVPNGAAAKWAKAIGDLDPAAVILDLSADHRFDPAWAYGLPEACRERIAGTRRIANPGCYATGALLGLLPLQGRLAAPPVVYGISGYSGAGRTPGPRNDPQRLRDNLMPYTLAGHVHELEISHHLGSEVRFMPHVAAFFRGISLTIAVELAAPAQADELLARYQDHYMGERLLRVQAAIPEIRDVRGGPEIHLGGFTVDARDARRVTLVAVLDNLGKGAASQALQNLNLALGLPEYEGIVDD